MRTYVPCNSPLPYHVTARTPNREHFKIPMEEVWQIFEDYLYLTKVSFNLQIHAFVLMPNHFHLLASAPDGNISLAMNYLIREVSREINRRSGRINQNWGRRHHKTLVSSYHHFMNVYKYIYQNPVRARLCKRADEYSFSTLSGLCGRTHLVIPLAEDTTLFNPEFCMEAFQWLNTAASPKNEDEIRTALRKQIFVLSKNQNTGFLSKLEGNLI